MIFLAIVCVNQIRLISLHLTTCYMLMALFFSQEHARDFKTALKNYSSAATNGNLKSIQQTKTMIFEKKQLPMLNSFTFNAIFIETCKSYPYFGSLISNNGQFKLHISELFKSAIRAMYTLLGNVNKFSSGNISILLDLFDKMILPICTYN